MEIIPLVYFNDKKIQIEKDGEKITPTDFIEKLEGYKCLYVLDLDGLKKNKPNLCSYKKLSEKCDLWIDFGPLSLGDVVDSFMAGANTITIRRKIWHEVDFSNIKQLSENKVYVGIAANDLEETNAAIPYFRAVDGLILFNEKNQITSNFKYRGILNGLHKRYKTYVYDSYSKNVSYWEKLGVKGVLVDLYRYKEFLKCKPKQK